MAHRIYAVDIGAWSLKVAIAEPGFRQATLVELIERPIPPGDDPHEDRAARVLGAIVTERQLEHDTAYLVVGGEQLFTKILDFPFTSLRRSDLDKAVGGELEGVVPLDLEEMVYAFEPVPPVAAAPPVAVVDLPTTDEEPTKVQGGRAAAPRGRVAPSAGMRVLTYAMARTRALELIAMGRAQKAEPRGLLPVASALVRFAARAAGAVPPAAPTAIIDLGHERTDVVVLQAGKPVWSRTIARGGRHVTDAIATSWRLPFGEAERAKHSDGFVASTAEPASSEAWARVSEVIAAELAPLARDLRQSFTACKARTGVAVEQVMIVGGASRLRGVAGFLADALGVPVVTTAGAAAAFGALAPAAIDSGAVAIGAVLDGASGKPLFDLRHGALAFKVDLSFLRARAYQIATAVVVVLAFAAASAWASHYKLRKAEKVLTDRLAAESSEYFGDGKPRTADEVLNEDKGTVSGGASPLPKMTGYDILLAINEKLPARDKITLDITNLEITDSSVQLKGSTKKTDEIDVLETALKDVACLGPASRGATQTTAEGSQFQLSYKLSCM